MNIYEEIDKIDKIVWNNDHLSDEWMALFKILQSIAKIIAFKKSDNNQ